VIDNYLTVGASTIGMFLKECEGRSIQHYKFKQKDALYKKILGVEKKGRRYIPIQNRMFDEYRAITSYQGALNTSF
jgi:hypothetical protein